MYAICNTKSDDVKAALKMMKKQNVSYPIIQVGQKLYRQMKDDNSCVRQIVAGKTRKFFVNMGTGMVHKDGCTKQGKKTVEVYLVRPKDAGLPLCSLCMK